MYYTDNPFQGYRLNLIEPDCEDLLQPSVPVFTRPDPSPSPPTNNTLMLPTLRENFCDSSSSRIPPPKNLSDMSFKETDWRSSSPEESETQDRSVFDDDEGGQETMADATNIQSENKAFDALILDAKRKYGDEKPDFCTLTRPPADERRTVKLLSSEDTADIVFQCWMDNLYGYWILEDGVNQYIVKHERGQYFAWEGIHGGFSSDPVASILKGVSKKRRASPVHKGSENDDDAEASPIRTFRARTLRQEKPYQMYNAQRKLEDRGVLLTESGLEDSLIQHAPLPHKKQPTRTNAVAKPTQRAFNDQETVSISNTTSSITSLPTTTSTSMCPLLPGSSLFPDGGASNHAVLRTRLDSSKGPAIPIFLQTIQGSNQLFERFHQKWAFKLNGKKLAYCVANFAWLEEDKSILIQENDEDGYQLLCDEVRRAPAWQRGQNVDVTIELFTV